LLYLRILVNNSETSAIWIVKQSWPQFIRQRLICISWNEFHIHVRALQTKYNHQREVVHCASPQREGGRDQAIGRVYEYVKLLQTDPTVEREKRLKIVCLNFKQSSFVVIKYWILYETANFITFLWQIFYTIYIGCYVTKIRMI
jgi:hypothetical protein